MFKKPHDSTVERTFSVITPAPVGFVVGVDVGKKHDYTAINVITRSVGWNVCMERARFEPQPVERDRKRFLAHGITHVKKIALGTPYPEVARRVCALMDELPAMPEKPVLVVDATGVGQPIVDMFRGVGLRPVAVTITGGKQIVKHSSREISIPKLVLVENVKALIQDGRLKVARGLDLEGEIRAELAAFGQKISDTGHESFEGVGEHDDIVLSIALSAWVSEHMPTPMRVLENLNIMAR